MARRLTVSNAELSKLLFKVAVTSCCAVAGGGGGGVAVEHMSE